MVTAWWPGCGAADRVAGAVVNWTALGIDMSSGGLIRGLIKSPIKGVVGGGEGSGSQWLPTKPVDGSLPDLWMRPDTGVATAGARKFTAGDKGHFQIASNPSLTPGDTDFSIAGFVYFTGVSTSQIVLAKDNGVAPREFIVDLLGSKLRFLLFDSGGSTSATHPTVLVANTWYFFHVWHSATDNEVGIRINNGAATTTTTTLAANSGSAPLRVGGNFVSTNSLGGNLARLIFAKRLWTASERTFLFNSGEGRLAGELGVVGTDGAALRDSAGGSLPSYWNLNEGSGTANAIDSIGTNDLVPTFAELITNGGFETAGGGGADVFGSWAESAAGSSTVNDETVDVDAGAHACRLDIAGGSTASVRQSILTVGSAYSVSVRAKSSTGIAPTGKVQLGTTVLPLTLTTSYATHAVSGVAAGTSDVYLERNVSAGDQSIYFDSVSVKATQIPAIAGPMEMLAQDSIGTNDGVLTNMDSIGAWSSDVPAAIGSGYSLKFDGTDDYLSCGNVGNVTTFDFYVKSLLDNQELFTLANSTATAVTVAAGVLTFGASLSASAITVDGVAKTGAEAGVILNDNAWHRVTFTLVSVAASDLRLGTDSSGFGNIHFDDFKIGTANHWTFDDGPQSQLISDGDPVVQWQDKITREQFNQITGSARPIWIASASNGHPGLQFDGVDDSLVGTLGSLASAGAFTMFVVAKATDTAADRVIIGGQNAKYFLQTFEDDMYSRVDASNYGVAAFASTAVSIWTLRFDGSAVGNAGRLRRWLNSVEQTLTYSGTIPATTAAGSGLALARSHGGSSNFVGDQLELIIYPFAMSESGMAKVHGYLHSFHGIAAP